MAYGAHLRGVDVKVTTVRSAKPFFYFLPSIRESHISQAGQDTRIYNIDFDPKKAWGKDWAPPPLKEYYSKISPLVLRKPILVINNKYNLEWGRGPFNVFDIDILSLLFTMLQDKYDIYYIRYDTGVPLKTGGYYDEVPSVAFDDYKVIKKNFPKINTIYDFINEHKIDYNTAQCLIMSKADKHISVAGGSAALSSYFAGENIIYGHPTKGGHRGVWGTNSWLKLLGKDSKIYGYTDYGELASKCSELWL